MDYSPMMDPRPLLLNTARLFHRTLYCSWMMPTVQACLGLPTKGHTITVVSAGADCADDTLDQSLVPLEGHPLHSRLAEKIFENSVLFQGSTSAYPHGLRRLEEPSDFEERQLLPRTFNSE
jgi:hypothetical protein